ncbi:threonylcarbamoyl-AMP synthase [Fusibacter paucivorans]|uniref:Threonylcarbamoyl-AMP synthase n=1 Tax=Fusibacter paucivorans TaxID=76009 RepID=A0ABS5PKZ2_9FIRM|nr:L-threonylcarbamoyladenylate synthase [Fusibacter paucivorans]MBS7525824.1 threonylcarbamoyl-AMP synthase [Fusibacter paucivorans]
MKETIIFDVRKLTGDALAWPALKGAAKLLKANGTVAFPTETVYGLGANALDETAIESIYTAKGRPSDNPLIVHISRRDMLNDLVASVPETAARLMDAFWPGPMTLIFKKRSVVPDKVTGGLDTVAIRMPSHIVARALIDLSNLPIAAPSANLSGKPSPTTAEHVIHDLMGRVDGIVLGDDAMVGLESTVIDMTGDIPVILRPGAITEMMVAEIAGDCETDAALKALKGEKSVPKAPGMKYRHYAPNAEVTVFTGDTVGIIKAFEAAIDEAAAGDYKIAILLFSEDLAVLNRLMADNTCGLDHAVLFDQGSAKDPAVFASRLFRDLRASDDFGCKRVLVHGIAEEGIGSAIMNRLLKAAEGSVIRI